MVKKVCEQCGSLGKVEWVEVCLCEWCANQYRSRRECIENDK